MKLSKRLELVASLVPKGARLLDVGSDHAYLPSYLAQNHLIDYAIAGEVVKGPFESAKQTVTENQLDHLIDVRLGDGIEVIKTEDNINTVTICGMGGDLIASILNRGYDANLLGNVEKFILQPNVDAHSVRQWLMEHQYEIIEEYIIEENLKIYEVIVGKPSNRMIDYTKDQLTYGVYLPLEKSTVFIKKWQSEHDKYSKIIGSLEKSSKNESEKIQYFKSVQQEIEEMLT